MKKISRRNFAKLSAGTIAAGVGMVAGTRADAAPTTAAAVSGPMARPAGLPKAKGPRVVVVGGGWSGLTIAKYVKRQYPGADVVLIERRTMFVSCPMSNLWMAGLVDLDTITFSFLDGAKSNGYTFFNATVIDVDRTKRRVFTEQGWVDYDFLALAPGIEYDYKGVGVEDPEDINRLRTDYPAGYMPGSEHLSIREKIDNFEEGTFVLTVPSGNYRCMPAPFERACLIASIFKRGEIPGKVLLVDPREEPLVKADGFLTAFQELYPDHIEYLNKTDITGIDVSGKKLLTEFDEIPFDDAAIYPRVRGHRLIEQLGLVNPQSLQYEANIDQFTYNVIGDERIYVSGDCRPMPFSKSGNTARSEAMYVSKVIAARAQGKEVPAWESPHTICYSMVNDEPQESIMVDSFYAFDAKTKEWGFDRTKVFNGRTAAMGAATMEWAMGHYRDMFMAL